MLVGLCYIMIRIDISNKIRIASDFGYFLFHTPGRLWVDLYVNTATYTLVAWENHAAF